MRYSLILVFLAILFYIPFLGGVHLFDWDEINFAEASREMLLLDEYMRIYINYEPFWEKPPLFLWFQAFAMKLFGVGEFAARLPNAICGVLTLVFVYHIGKRLYGEKFGFIWGLVYFGSILPFLYFKSGIIDPFFNLFIFAGIYYFILAYWKKEQLKSTLLSQNEWLYFLIGGLFIGLAILTKGPVAYLILGLTLFVYWVMQRFRLFVSIPQFIFFTLSALSVTLIWFGVETWHNGPWLVEEFITYQVRLFSTPDAGHKGFFGYHFVVLLVGCFPASIFAIRAFWGLPRPPYQYQRDFTVWMVILFWVVLLLFSIVQSKIVHYSSLCYFPLTFLASLTIHHIIADRIGFNKWMKIGVGFLGIILVIVTFLVPFVGQHPKWIQPLLAKDPFATANLEAAITWTGIEVIPSIFYAIVLILFFISTRYQPTLRSFKVLFIGTATFIFLSLGFFINNIEGYSQRAAIEFYESKQQEDCYIFSHGFKTYAHLFYAQKRPITNPKSLDKDWLLNGEVDKPVYVVCKIHKAHELEALPQLQRVHSKNGFVFFKRR